MKKQTILKKLISNFYKKPSKQPKDYNMLLSDFKEKMMAK